MKAAALLEHNEIDFDVLPGAPEAIHETCEAAHSRGRQIARTQLLKTPEGFIIAIVPNMYTIDFESLQQHLGTRPVRNASSEEAAAVFPELPAGTIPTFGSPFGVKTLLDIHLLCSPTMLLPDWQGNEWFRISVQDYIRAENPMTGHFAVPPILE